METVKVRISVEKRERYYKIVTMDKEKFNEYYSQLNSDDRDEERLAIENIGELVDGRDWFDGETEEVDEFEIVKID